ncbi:MAG: DUF2339 domain-containing protein [Burkholderiaceae bacterium]|nr:DUF2339 domain-containing protein [Burkholderiaceae bacterium]
MEQGNTQAIPNPGGGHPPPVDFNDRLRDWIFGGNVVAKLGLLILFMGLGFLLRYLNAAYQMPIEYQLAGVAAAALALLAWGWSIRLGRPGISLPVQGTALSVLMLATFAATKNYSLIPAPAAIALLAIFVGFTCLLAVLQDSVWLAVFGIIGGFATPVMMSDGSGNHVALFTWCAILNAGIIAIAILKSWRILNVLGFVCTFTLATSWGVLNYDPNDYRTSQSFLLLFLLMYIAVAMFYARQQAPRLTHYVDGTLVFGAPLAAMGLQYGLVRDIPFGMAYSALALGALYLVLAIFVKRRMGPHCRLLGEAFMALGIVSATLAIPYGVDDRWMSAAWALEAAGVIWTGLRQRRTLAWCFGLLVQLASWLSFLRALSRMDEATIAASHMAIGFVMLALAAFFIALQLRSADADTLKPFSAGTGKGLAELLLPVAAAWLLAGAWLEVIVQTDGYAELNLMVGGAIGVAAALYGICLRWQWRSAGWLAQVALLLACVTFILMSNLSWAYDTGSLLNSAIPAALMLALSLSVLCQRRHAGNPDAAGNGAMLWFAGIAWFLIALPALAAWGGGVAAVRLASETLPFSWSLYLMLVAALSTLALQVAQRSAWPQLIWLSVPAFGAQQIAGGAMLIWLYWFERLPDAVLCGAGLMAWVAADHALACWRRTDWIEPGSGQTFLHLQLVAMPLLMVWPALRIVTADVDTLGPEWQLYLPAWGLMAATAWLLHRAAHDAWPLSPLTLWHRRVTLRVALGWSLLVTLAWNFASDGGMAPLPYVPVLNPLDVTTGFAALLAISYWRGAATQVKQTWGARMQLLGAGAAWLWFNLMLLRSVSHYLDVAYTFDALMGSTFTQAMLSLVWSGTALVLMRHAAVRLRPRQWGVGAALLLAVLVKLFLHDLHDRNNIITIAAFIGVGLLTLAIGYAAPLPRRSTGGAV